MPSPASFRSPSFDEGTAGDLEIFAHHTLAALSNCALSFGVIQLPTYRGVRGFPPIQSRRDLDSRGGKEDRQEDRSEDCKL